MHLVRIAKYQQPEWTKDVPVRVCDWVRKIGLVSEDQILKGNICKRVPAITIHSLTLQS